MESFIRGNARFEVFTAVKIQFEVFWVLTPSSVVGYQRFGGPCCLHLQGEVPEDGGSKAL
jgi:hypothetical protein